MSEFERPLGVAEIGRAPVARSLEARPAERSALAKRFDLIALDRMSADLAAERIAGGVTVTGHVRAAGTQACAVSGLPVAFAIDERVTLRFEPLALPSVPDAEVELDAADLDVLPLTDSIDLGEAAAEALALALDPYPKASDAELAEARALLTTEEALARARNPFGVLQGIIGDGAPGADR